MALKRWDDYPRNWYEWNINCPIDGKNDYEGEHEVYQANHQINDNLQLEVLLCEMCGHNEERKVERGQEGFNSVGAGVFKGGVWWNGNIEELCDKLNESEVE